jgi:hypothetical protein
MRPRYANLLLPLVTAVLAGCAATRDTIAPGIVVPDADGHPVRPFAAKDAVAVVFVFLANDCPIANRAVPELLRLEQAYAPRGVKFWPVHAGADESDASVRGHAKEYGLTTVPLRDPDLRLARDLGAGVTPTAVVVSPRGEVLYRGRIDDRYAALGQSRPEPTRRDLALAIEAVVAGKRPEPAETPAVGCRIGGTR